MKTIEDKIIKLEIYIANVERDLDELNKVVIQQSEVIRNLTKEIENMKERFKDLGETPGFEKPPHY